MTRRASAAVYATRQPLVVAAARCDRCGAAPCVIFVDTPPTVTPYRAPCCAAAAGAAEGRT